MSKSKSNGSASDGHTNVVSSLDNVPVTKQRVPWTNWKKVKESGIARANIAVTEVSPDGATEPKDFTEKHAQETVLQQHVVFFDLNNDGVINVYETYIGFRLLGWGILLSLLAMTVIHGGFSWYSLPPGRWLPDPFFRIYIKDVNGAKHGSDTGTYDHEGRFRAQQFADFFSKYGEQLSDGSWGITYPDALKGARGQRCVNDPFGWLAELFEWTATWLTIWPHDGIMRMEDVRGVYDGSYFFKIAGERRQKYVKGELVII
ncbi:caleosin domain-containing protein [Phanerochaete sordida]|uniref:Caleosin domain-containing protein n=1 Tax=Phanerochaete sordida TaxID=48140 RepID=A0A9P3LA95_9APHY|nr:caleosin domain-containing protein [Phanerochaete sordida]